LLFGVLFELFFALCESVARTRRHGAGPWGP